AEHRVRLHDDLRFRDDMRGDGPGRHGRSGCLDGSSGPVRGRTGRRQRWGGCGGRASPADPRVPRPARPPAAAATSATTPSVRAAKGEDASPPDDVEAVSGAKLETLLDARANSLGRTEAGTAGGFVVRRGTGSPGIVEVTGGSGVLAMVTGGGGGGKGGGSVGERAGGAELALEIPKVPRASGEIRCPAVGVARGAGSTRAAASSEMSACQASSSAADEPAPSARFVSACRRTAIPYRPCKMGGWS